MVWSCTRIYLQDSENFRPTKCRLIAQRFASSRKVRLMQVYTTDLVTAYVNFPSGLSKIRSTKCACSAVLFFWPKYRLAHPENYLFLLSIKQNSGSKYPKNNLFNFENRSTVVVAYMNQHHFKTIQRNVSSDYVFKIKLNIFGMLLSYQY